ncbi:MAG: BREX system P-loop protein BrxC [Lewinellaceae bacterium]|nr:BREX system P-loop protein BrxC [Lewinellaceae bacterium]
MATIKDILQLDFAEDIKNVIDLEDQSENEIQSEIEAYILTDGLAKHLSDFIKAFSSNIKETGVWISGFYGSGKSYFGKMLGHILDNQPINGTPARDRFLPRIKGVKNEVWLENDIRKLDAYSAKVVFLDIAKQNTDNGLEFTLFSNFLKKMGFRGDLFGFIEFDLLLEGKLEEFEQTVKAISGKPWAEVKRNNRETAKAVRQAHLKMGYSEKEYEDTKETYEQDIKFFSASKLKDQLLRYLEKNPDEIIVFIFDEASEALSQQKFNLLGLEGVSEALSSLGSRVWTIAIAQEKLDDVINNSNVSKSQLTKVTDRFKSKFHLESTEVDVIIRNRLLKKKEGYLGELEDYFKQHEGQISDLTNLKSTFPTKTSGAEAFATYFPFHKYQFDLLQKFLFSSNQLAASQIAARGMIITTFDVLRKEIKDRPMYAMATAHDLCTEAQTAPPTALGIKYDNARRILQHQQSGIIGDQLLKTIHFLTESELASASLENITKAYIEDIDSYYKVKPQIEEALEYLVEAKLLLPPVNQAYKITSDLEGKLLEEMQDFTVELFVKKRDLVSYLKKTGLFKGVSTLHLDDLPYKFNIVTDLDDEIDGSSNKNLKFVVYNIFNIEGSRQDFVEGVKMDTQYDKGKMTLLPDNAKFQEMDRLLTEVKKFTYIEEKYGNDDDAAKRQIIREFVIIKEEKEKRLSALIREAYEQGSLVYLFDEYYLNSNSFKGEVNDVQTKLVRNTYTKRLSSQLSDAIAVKVLKERDASRLGQYFSGVDFNFFDGNGNFVGDHLKVVEEINNCIKNSYLDGRSLEMKLNDVPWGYSYGTLASTMAALFRAGKVVVKYGGANNQSKEYFSYRETAVHEVFVNTRKFGAASFKSVTRSLSASEKNQAVQALLDLDYQEHTGEKVDWNTSDFELAEAVRRLAEHFLTILTERRKDVPHFDGYFPVAAKQRDVLKEYTAKTTEANYVEKAQFFLQHREAFAQALEAIDKASGFIRKNLARLHGFDSFLQSVANELAKAGLANEMIASSIERYEELKQKSIVNHFNELQQQAQKARDVYYQLMVEAAQKMTALYQPLLADVQAAQQELKAYPESLNRSQAHQLGSLAAYAQGRIVERVKLEYQITCQLCGFSLSDILNYIELANSKQSDLLVIRSGFVKEKPQPAPVAEGKKEQPRAPRKLKLEIPRSKMTVANYRNLLAQQLQSIAGMDGDDLVEVDLGGLSD